MGAALVWAYWPVFRAMADRWISDPQYSHGYLVPLFSVALLVLRRDKAPGLAARADWRGLVVLVAAAAAYVAAGYLYIDWLAAASMIVAAAGLFLLAGGVAALRWAGPAVAFLVFMVPLPFRVETALSGPLRQLATAASTFTLQTMGLPAFAEGNVIVLSRGRIGVAEACSGLSMLLVFVALAVAVVLLVRRPALDKAVILLAAVPVAVIANVARIVVTGLAQEWGSPELAERLFHDWAGWLMMPFALGLLWLVLRALDRALVRAPERQPVTATLPIPTGLAPAPHRPGSRGRRRR